MPARTSPPVRRGLRLALAATAAVALGAVGALPAPDAASAVVHMDVMRLEYPVKAGSLITGEDRSRCTAGPVLYFSSIYYNLRPQNLATRYVLTAKHCFPLHSTVSLPGGVRGAVTWQSSEDDVEIIRIDPHSYTHQMCDDTSFHGLTCHPVTAWEPRAAGRIIHVDQRTGIRTRLQVAGPGAPAVASTRLCLSGITTDVTCGWEPTRLSPDQHAGSLHMSGARSRWSSEPGDSGAPVYTPDGHVHGVLRGSGAVPGGSVMGYTPIDAILAQLPGYHLAS
jgi:hypothetical protein